jgi:hypothetical protein
MTRVAGFITVLLLGVGVTSAHAQDDRRFGLAMGYPTAVGVLWHATGRIAIRPELDASRAAVKTESTSSLLPIPEEEEATTSSVRPGISVLFYLARRDELRLYVSPRYSYIFTGNSQSGLSERSTWLVSGSIGAQHDLGSRFAVFGELGSEYSRSTSRLSSPSIFSVTTRTSAIGLRAGVGVVLYF